MDTIEFEGKTYQRRGAYWIYNNEAVCRVLQRKLNAEFEKETDITTLNFEELRRKGGLYFKNGDTSLAALYFEKALADYPHHKELKTVLPKLCRCYNSLGHLEKTVELFEKYKDEEKYISKALINSVCYAYYNLGDEEKFWAVARLL